MNFINSIKDNIEDIKDKIDDANFDGHRIGNFVDDLSCIDEVIANVKECHTSAFRTVELCTETLKSGSSLVKCGETIASSLLSGKMDPESFEVIADLIDGDMSKQARSLAVNMKDDSTECISLAVKMVDSLQKSVDALPNFMENFVEGEAEKKLLEEGLTHEERELAGGKITDSAERELKSCVTAIEELKLLTAIDAGRNAFDAIKGKSELCNRIFQMIKKFAGDVVEISTAITNKDAGDVIKKIKDGSILRAIGLGKYIKQFASACKRIMDMIISLFHGAAEKLGSLWKALSHAKDVMVKSLTDVVDARALCTEASEEAGQLKETTASFVDVQGMVGKFKKNDANQQQERGVDSIGGGNPLDAALETARKLEKKMEGAAMKMMTAAKSVGDAFTSLPSIITDGIKDATDDDDDDAVAKESAAKARSGGDVNSDVHDLEAATASVENANIAQILTSVKDEVTNIPDKVDTCREMVDGCGEFADLAKSAVNSFLHGKWTLETAINYINKMCKLVSFSDLMEALAAQVQKLIKAIATFLKVISAKIQEIVDNPLAGLGGMVDDLNIDGHRIDNFLKNNDVPGEDLLKGGLNMMGSLFGKKDGGD